MKSGRLFRLKLEEATFGGDTEPVLPIASTGFQTLHVNNLRSREIEADDEIAHNGNVYVVISKGQAFDNPLPEGRVIGQAGLPSLGKKRP